MVCCSAKLLVQGLTPNACFRLWCGSVCGDASSRPNAVAFGNDAFKDMRGIESGTDTTRRRFDFVALCAGAYPVPQAAPRCLPPA